MGLYDIKPKGKHMAAVIAASAVIGAPMTLTNEGMKLFPYYDGAGIKTWCAGETEVGYQPKFSYSECKNLFDVRYGYYSVRTSYLYNDVGQSIVTPQAHAAITDLSYNIGISAVGKSSIIRKLNSGDLKGACESIVKYKYVGNTDCSLPSNARICGGVWKRRLQMRDLCLSNSVPK